MFANKADRRALWRCVVETRVVFEEDEDIRPGIDEGTGTETEGVRERKVETIRSSSLRFS